jgi:predicted Zn-dependent peptidase
MSAYQRESLEMSFVTENLNKAPIHPDLIPFTFPRIKEKRLANDLHLMVIERPELPKVYIRLGIQAGTKNDPPAMTGLGQLLALTQKKGTKQYNYPDLTEKIEQVGGEIDTMINEDFLVVYGEFLKDHIETGMNLFKQICLQPTFPEEELEKERFKQMADLENEKSSPDFLAHRRAEKAMFAPHPYSYYKTADSLKTIAQPNLQEFHEKYFASENAVIILAGDISWDEAVILVDKYFSNWNIAVLPSEEFEIPDIADRPLIHLVHRPNSQQTNILLGNLLFSRNHPDFEKMVVMNKILGGSGSGRLFMNLREDKGYTYGAYSTLGVYREAGAFLANAEVRTEVTVPALQAFHEEFQKLKTTLVSSRELENAKRYLRGIFPLQNETPASIAALALRQRLYDLGEDYWNRYISRIGHVTGEEVREVANNYIREDRMTTVVVGDADKLQKSLSDLGEVMLFDLEDNRIN